MASIKKKTWARRISKTPVSFNNNNNNNNNQYIQQNLSSADANTPSKNINGKSAQGNEYVVFEVESPADMNSSISDSQIFPLVPPSSFHDDTATNQLFTNPTKTVSKQNHKKSYPIIGGHKDRIFHCAFAPYKVGNNLDIFATASEDGSLCIWELIYGPYHSLPDQYKKSVWKGEIAEDTKNKKNDSSSFSNNIVGKIGDAVYYYDSTSNEKNGENGENDGMDNNTVYRIRYLRKLHGHHDECLRACWGRGISSNLIASAGADGNVIFWDLRTFKQHSVLRHGPNQQIYVCNFFPEDGSALLTGYDNLLSMWDVERKTIVCQWSFLSSQVNNISNNNSNNNTKTRRNLEAERPYIYSGDSSLHRCLTAAGLSDGSIRIIDPRSGTTCSSFKAHDSYICDVNFSPNDGNYLVSSSGNGSMKIWDVRKLDTEKTYGINISSPYCLLSFGQEKQRAPIYGCAWSKNNATSIKGLSIYSWSIDGSLRQYNAQNGLEYSSIPSSPNDNFPILSFDSTLEGNIGIFCGGTNSSKCDNGGSSTFHLVPLSSR